MKIFRCICLCQSRVFLLQFINEEKFGWQVHQLSPSTLRVIDTQDLHFLRNARQDLVKETQSDWKVSFLDHDLFFYLSVLSFTQTILNVKPDCTSKSVIRELSSILRSDLTLLISRHEMDLLRELKEIPSDRLHYFPFAYDKPPDPRNSLSFDDRQHFVMLVQISQIKASRILTSPSSSSSCYCW